MGKTLVNVTDQVGETDRPSKVQEVRKRVCGGRVTLDQVGGINVDVGRGGGTGKVDRIGRNFF